MALTGHMTMNLVLVINDKFYQGLSPELRAIFVKSMQDAGDFESEMQIGMNQKNAQDLKDKGMIITAVNKADFAEKTKDTWKQFEARLRQGLLRESRRSGEVNRYPRRGGRWPISRPAVFLPDGA